MLIIIILSVIMLDAITLNVVSPLWQLADKKCVFFMWNVVVPIVYEVKLIRDSRLIYMSDFRGLFHIKLAHFWTQNILFILVN